MEKFCQPFHFTSLFYMMCQKVAQCSSKFFWTELNHTEQLQPKLSELTLS